MVNAWFSDLVSATTADQRRAQCANAAQQRANAPAINLTGLGGNDMARRRAKCLEAALMRFVSKDMPAMLPQRRGTKRKSTHGPVVREILLEMTGDRFHPFMCGSTYWYPPSVYKVKASDHRPILGFKRGSDTG